MKCGTIQVMEVQKEASDYYILEQGLKKFTLPKNEATRPLQKGEAVEVFVLESFVTMHLPRLSLGEFDWVRVEEVSHEKIYVDIGTSELVEIDARDLPAYRKVWPQVGDYLYVVLKQKSSGRLFAVPAKEREFTHLIEEAYHLELNDKVTGRVIRTAREGTVLLTEEGYRAFIHRSEREEEPRLGEEVTARIIEVKEDGTLNASLKPMKHERLERDAEHILQYLIEHDGVIPFDDYSPPEAIRSTFNMSKAAFKRALGRLMRQKKVEQRDGHTYLIE
mgnify:CR=1 FL=1